MEQERKLRGDAGAEDGFAAPSARLAADVSPPEPADRYGEQQNRDPDRLAPGIEQQREDEQQRVFDARPWCGEIQHEQQGQKSEQEREAGEHHFLHPAIAV